jgi:hypothetical protein
MSGAFAGLIGSIKGVIANLTTYLYATKGKYLTESLWYYPVNTEYDSDNNSYSIDALLVSPYPYYLIKRAAGTNAVQWVKKLPTGGNNIALKVSGTKIYLIYSSLYYIIVFNTSDGSINSKLTFDSRESYVAIGITHTQNSKIIRLNDRLATWDVGKATLEEWAVKAWDLDTLQPISYVDIGKVSSPRGYESFVHTIQARNEYSHTYDPYTYNYYLKYPGLTNTQARRINLNNFTKTTPVYDDYGKLYSIESISTVTYTYDLDGYVTGSTTTWAFYLKSLDSPLGSRIYSTKLLGFSDTSNNPPSIFAIDRKNKILLLGFYASIGIDLIKLDVSSSSSPTIIWQKNVNFVDSARGAQSLNTLFSINSSTGNIGLKYRLSAAGSNAYVNDTEWINFAIFKGDGSNMKNITINTLTVSFQDITTYSLQTTTSNSTADSIVDIFVPTTAYPLVNYTGAYDITDVTSSYTERMTLN